MASALQLTATATIINGQGLNVSPDLVAEISAFQNLKTVKLVANLYATATSANANVAANLLPVLSNLGSTATKAQFLIDFYPTNIAPTASGSVSYYLDPNCASVSGTVLSQAQLPFGHGMSGFANVFMTAYSYAAQSFDTISSIHLLKDKTYSQSGLGFKGPAELATNGLGSNGPLLANVVANWGTMYDVAQMSVFSDPYVFGQHLLDQGLGSYGNLNARFTAAGLDLTDIRSVPHSTSTTTQISSTITAASSIGAIDLPTLQDVTTTTTVTAVSELVLKSIYAGVTGSNLAAIVNATGITTFKSNSISTLADYLDFNKVVDPTLVQQLAPMGINNFTTLAQYIHKIAGQGLYTSWASLANFFRSIVVPSTTHTTASASQSVLSDSTINALHGYVGTGSGIFNNPIMSDYFGTTAGMPYTQSFNTIVNNYTSVHPQGVESALIQLDTAVTDYTNNPTTLSPVTSAVSAVNSALNSISNTDEYNQAQSVYLSILSKLSSEVANLTKAGVVFDSGYSTALMPFAQSIPSLATDRSQTQAYQIIGNIVTNDAAGDTIRAAISEAVNTSILASNGIQNYNDPTPAVVLSQSETQNIPLTTYITRNQ